MNKNVPFIWRVNYRNEVTPPEKVLEVCPLSANSEHRQTAD